MKIRGSLILLALSLLFFSCGGGLSQEGTGSVTMDAGRVAQHLARSAGIKARDVGSNFDGYGRDMDLASLYSFSMTVKLSTIGDYSASTQEKYKITMEEMAASGDAMESFFKTSLGKPITIEEIPVESRIRVKAEVSFGQEFDEDAYRKILKNSDLPDAYINKVLEGIKSEVSSNMTTAEGYSQEFTVKSGSNNVTIRLDGSNFYAKEWQNPIFTPDSNHPIILFNGREAENVLKYDKDDQLLPETIQTYSKGASLFSSISGGESITEPMFPSNTFCFADDCIYMVQDGEIYKITNSNVETEALELQTQLETISELRSTIHQYEGKFTTELQIDCLTYYDNALYFPLQIKRTGGYPAHGEYFVKLNISTNEISYCSNQNSNWSSLIVTSIDSNEFVIKLQNEGPESTQYGKLIKYRISESEGNLTLDEEKNCSLAYQASDLQLFGNTLYIACYKYHYSGNLPDYYLNSENTIYNIVSAGGIAKIDLNGDFSLSTWTNGSCYLGMYLGNTYKNNGELFESSPITPTKDQENQYFYGARKFIARRPDDNILVVADDGVYIDLDAPLRKDPNTCENKNRVVTVNLLDESISAVDVNVNFYATAIKGTFFGIDD